MTYVDSEALTGRTILGVVKLVHLFRHAASLSLICVTKNVVVVSILIFGNVVLCCFRLKSRSS